MAYVVYICRSFTKVNYKHVAIFFVIIKKNTGSQHNPGRIVWPQVRQICTSQTEKFSRYTLILYFSPIKYWRNCRKICQTVSDRPKIIEKLDVDPQRDDDASPMSTYRCMLRPTWMISALQHKLKYKSNSISNLFEKKKNQIFWFPCCSTQEDLSVDLSITYVGLILTKPGLFFSRYTETRGKDRIQFSQFQTFWKFSHFWVSMV